MASAARPMTSASTARLNAVGSRTPIAASDSELEYRFSEFAESDPRKTPRRVMAPSQPGSSDT